MLNRLIVKNVALIESAEIEFKSGLNVLSGETGSGKSVVLESINFVLGAKADRSLIRTGANECSVIAEFDVENNPAVIDALKEIDVEIDDTLLISRKFSDSGKNSIKINGMPANVGMLKKLTSLLIDVHGQSEHFYLLSTHNQLKLLDEFSGKESEEIKEELNKYHERYKSLSAELSGLGGSASDRLIRLDVLNYQISEIKNADIKEGEFEELTALKETLNNREKILTALNTAKNCIDDEGGASDSVSSAVRLLYSIAGLNGVYSELSERLNDIYAEIDDAASSLGNAIEELADSEYDPEEVEERLKVIKNIFKKYGGDLISVSEFLENAEQEKNKLENAEETALKLADEIEKVKKTIYALCGKLSEIRKKKATVFAGNVTEELKQLGMTKAKFFIEFSPAPSFDDCSFAGANGYDDIKFMFSANSGEPEKPLSEIISGGEMSRFMLAVKAQTAKYNDISTFIFDEIDAGISGVIARVVAEKLFDISRSAQVIAVSHLPQITSFADNNILIEKTEMGEKTYTTVKTLDGGGKIKEIERLLGALDGDKTANEHAKALVLSADDYKKSHA